MVMNTDHSLLLEKLDSFIRKFYINKLLRGALISVGLILALYIGISVAENYFYFAPSVKAPLFWGSVAICLSTLYALVAVPLMHYFRLGKTISHEQAAEIIGSHFSDVKDKLLNILQLKKLQSSSESRDLIEASINQKSKEIKFVPFQAAVNLAENKKYLRYALPPLLLLLFLFTAAPSLMKRASYRLLNYNSTFERPAPFRFVVPENKMDVVQFQDYDLQIHSEGDVLPSDVFIDVKGYQYRMKKENDTTFSYTFRGVQTDMPFKFTSGNVQSKDYNLRVIKKPNVTGFDISLEYPSYLGRPNETLTNQGDISVPIGTKVSWAFNAENTDDIKVSFDGGNPQSVIRQGESRFIFSKFMKSDNQYKLFFKNNFLTVPDSVQYNISVQADLSPTINAEVFPDSINKNKTYFAGDASDDYGLTSLSFNYQVTRAEGKKDAAQKTFLQQPKAKQIQFQHNVDFGTLNLLPGDAVSYYFEVFDNDAVNGAKSARTPEMKFTKASVQDIEKLIAKNNDDIKSELKKAIDETKKIQLDVEKLRDKMLQQKEIDWQTKKEVERLQQRQKDVDSKIDEAKKDFEKNQQNDKELNKQDEQLLKKQEQLKKMFDEIKNPEMKDLLKQIEELLQKMEKDKALDKIDDLKLNNEQLQKELERMDEAFKQMEVENLMQEQIDKLDDLSKKEDDLAKQNEEDKKSAEELKKEQDKINKDFDALEKKQDELEKKNKELKRPEAMPDTKEDDKEIKKDLEDSEKNLDDSEKNAEDSKPNAEKKEKKKAAKKQKSAANKMKNKSNKMKQASEEGKKKDNEEDLKVIRQLLENLVRLSFDQEATMKDMTGTVENTPHYVKLVQEQKKLQGDFGQIEDSLQMLANRQSAIKTFVIEKVTDIKRNMATAVDKLEDRKKYEGQDWQQRSMKTVNDLALMLSESMQNMQNDGEGQPGDGSCDKPGGKGKGKKGKGKTGKEPSDKIGEGQKSMNEGLKKLLERLKQGKDGKGGQGGQPGVGSKEFAQMAAQQAALREALKRKQKELEGRGKGDKGLQDIINGMEQTETELVNKNLNNGTLKRQDEILTRLLESEKAERERKEDEERKAEVAKRVEENTPPPSLQNYLNKRRTEIEQFKTVSPTLKPYYKQLVEDYYKAQRGK